MQIVKGITQKLIGLLIVLLISGGCQNIEPIENISVAEKPEIKEERIIESVEKLASLEFAGRRTGEEGEAEAALYLAQELQKAGHQPMGQENTYFQIFPLPEMDLEKHGSRAEFVQLRQESALWGDNVLAGLISKTRPDEFILISAHYDHLGIWQAELYPGANDNSSGVSAVLELSRVLNETSDLPYSFLFAFWSGEEMGLLGSNHFVNNPTLPLEKIKLVINIDSIGLGEDMDFIYWAENNDQLLEEIIDYLSVHNELAFQQNFTEKHTSDHRVFAQKSLPALTILAQDWLNNNHTSLDIAENINYKKIYNLINSIFDFLLSPEIEILLTTKDIN